MEEADDYSAVRVHTGVVLFTHTKILERSRPWKVRIASRKIAVKLISRYSDGEAWVHGSRLDAASRSSALKLAGTTTNLFQIDANVSFVFHNQFQLRLSLSHGRVRIERINRRGGYRGDIFVKILSTAIKCNGIVNNKNTKSIRSLSHPRSR